MESPKFSVSEFIEVCNQTLEYSFSSVLVEGEVTSFKINQDKWVFFDLKDENGSVGCFMAVWNLRMPLEDGMKVVVRGIPKLTRWGRFSITVQQIMPVGEGSIKKSFELLKKKLTDEGLFDPLKKRGIPENLQKIGVISSTQAAGYADFIKILNERWGGLQVLVAHTGVQGMSAADQIIRALNYFNEQGQVQIIAILRGGGSADDLAVFNDEKLVRAVAASKIPVITGIGHEIDESLCDLAADVRASTPSNAAQMLTRDRAAEIANVRSVVLRARNQIYTAINNYSMANLNAVADVRRQILRRVTAEQERVRDAAKLLEHLDPEKVLKQGYAILSGKVGVGNVVKITTFRQEISAEVKKISERSQS
ncbi:exodeoxyribonuclease VII large subunit [Candidatus Saccharibacteria bacterium]|nr:exodeoxyribonuclease VII large subunit [Candidatus Saccharibacteria bacterium]